MQKNNHFSFFCRMGVLFPLQASARFARGTRACARGAAAAAGGRAAAAADRDAKEKTNKFFLSNTCLFQKQKQSYLTVIVGLQDGKIRFK